LNILDRIRTGLKGSGIHGTNLLESPRTEVAHVEFTSRCNLRCVFCYASQPEYKGTDLDPETIENVIDSLKTRNVKVLSVNGHGETTIYKNWYLFCNKMIDAGLPLHMISNFSKEFSTEEIRTLSHFKSVEISCDSNNPELFKKLRRGADLKILCLNLVRLRGTVMKENLEMPIISFSCVISDQNVFDLPDYVAFGKALGVAHFNFCNLTKYPDIQDGLNPKHITEMPQEDLPRVEQTIMRAFDFLKQSNIVYHFQQGLLDSLKQKLNEMKTPSIHSQPATIPVSTSEEIKPADKPFPEAPLDSQPPVESLNNTAVEKTNEDDSTAQFVAPSHNPIPGQPHRYSSRQTESQTRDCLDPWSFILVQSNRNVLPCCWHQPVHSLGKNQSLTGVFNGSRFKELRLRLLTGDLTPDCLNCPSRGWTTTQNLKRKVWSYLNPGLNKLRFQKIPDIIPDVFTPYPITYSEGWYPLETNSQIPNPDWQQWRWIGRKAFCTIQNPRKKTLLIIRGSVDKSIHSEQKISFQLQDTLLDEFIPGTSKFFKEYLITPEMMGITETVSFSIETDCVFIPSRINPGVDDNRELGLQIYYLFFGEKSTAQTSNLR